MSRFNTTREASDGLPWASGCDGRIDWGEDVVQVRLECGANADRINEAGRRRIAQVEDGTCPELREYARDGDRPRDDDRL